MLKVRRLVKRNVEAESRKRLRLTRLVWRGAGREESHGLTGMGTDEERGEKCRVRSDSGEHDDSFDTVVSGAGAVVSLL
jgi:hypothetical protein